MEEETVTVNASMNLDATVLRNKAALIAGGLGLVVTLVVYYTCKSLIQETFDMIEIGPMEEDIPDS